MVARLGLGLGVGPRGYVSDNPSASLTFDFTRNRYRLNGVSSRAFSSATISGLTVTRATPSVAYAETVAGVLVPFAANVARITDKGLLVEEARTNLLLRSQEFDNASWSKTSLTIVADASAAPDGTTTADKFVEDVSAANHGASQSATKPASALPYTFSFYAKAAERSRLVVWVYGATTADRVQVGFDLSNGTIWSAALNVAGFTGGTAAIEAKAGGWYRCTVTVTTDAATAVQGRIFLNDGVASPSVPSYAGNGASGAYVWGAQLEAGAFPTSYIPTTSASATRAADAVSIGGLSVAAPFTVSMRAALQGFGATGFPGLLAVDDGTVSNRVLMFRDNSTGNIFRQAVFGGASQGSISAGSGAANTTQKLASREATNDAAMSRNGAAVVTDVTVAYAAMSRILLGSTGAGQEGNAYTQSLVIYPTAFTDAQLIAATA